MYEHEWGPKISTCITYWLTWMVYVQDMGITVYISEMALENSLVGCIFIIREGVVENTKRRTVSIQVFRLISSITEDYPQQGDDPAHHVQKKGAVVLSNFEPGSWAPLQHEVPDLLCNSGESAATCRGREVTISLSPDMHGIGMMTTYGNRGDVIG